MTDSLIETKDVKDLLMKVERPRRSAAATCA